MSETDIERLIKGLTENQDLSLRWSLSNPGPGGTIQITTGLRKSSTLATDAVLNGLIKRGLVENYRPRDEDLPRHWSGYKPYRLTALGKEVARRLEQRFGRYGVG